MEAAALADVPFAANPAWYRRITAALREVYWVGDVDRTRFIYVSPAFEELWGIPVSALYADPTVWMAAIHPEDRRRTVEAMYAGEEGEVEYRIVRADGAVRWMHTRHFTTCDDTGFPSVVGVTADVTARREAQERLARQEAVLRGVAQATHALLTAPDFAGGVARAFDLLGTSTGVDRVYLFENHRCPETGALLTSQRYEWAGGAAAPQIDNPELQGVPYADLVPRWEEVLGRGDVVCGQVRDFPAGERAVLEPQGIVSILVVPVVVDGAFWGFVGFDDCTAERAWSEGERSVLTIAASSLGAAFARERGGGALRESEGRYRLLAETATDVIVTVDDASLIRYANPAATHVLGYAPEELVGADLGLLIPERFHEAHREGMARYVATGERRLDWGYVEVPMRRRDGVEVPIAISFGAYRQDGRLLFTAFLRDVSAQKAAERAVRESEGQHRHLLDTIREVVFQTDADGRWTFLNPAWTEITGFPVAESLGVGFLDYVHPDDRALNAERFAPLIAREKEECRHTVRYLTRDGGFRWIEVTARLVLDDADGIVGTAGTLADVTEQRQAMAALEATLGRERELGELKTRFVSMASHELRTPLAAIQSSAELVGRFVARGDTDRVEKHVARIQSNVHGMTELLEDVLLMGKAEEGQLSFEPVPLELGAALHEIVEQVRLGVGARHRFAVALPPDPVPALADRKLLHLVLGNLLSNAAKYAEPGTTIDVGLRVTPGPDGDAVAVSVRDRGIGIPAADLPRLFEAFHRASNVGSRRGTGLGLAIVQRAADLHGGRIEVASVADEGSTFTLHLPLHTP